jgi:hypothetical protein
MNAIRMIDSSEGGEHDTGRGRVVVKKRGRRGDEKAGASHCGL